MTLLHALIVSIIVLLLFGCAGHQNRPISSENSPQETISYIPAANMIEWYEVFTRELKSGKTSNEARDIANQRVAAK